MSASSLPPPKLAKDPTGLAKAGRNCGIIALFAGFIPVVGVVVAVVGVVLSCLGLKSSTRLGSAITGLVLSLGGLVVAAIVSVLLGPTVLQLGSASVKLVRTMPSAEEQAAGATANQLLVKGAKFPDFSFTDVDGVKRTLSDYRGKVVLVDFWATWCSSCLEDLPDVQAAYDHYHSAGFEILGVSLEVQDKEKFTAGLRDRGMAWPQFYDGNWWNSALAVKFGVRYVPQDYLLDRNGMIISKDPPAKELASAVAAALQAR